MELVECNSWHLSGLSSHPNEDDIYLTHFYLYGSANYKTRRIYNMYRSLIGLDIYSIKSTIGNNILK